jgi:hypothetical protein
LAAAERTAAEALAGATARHEAALASERALAVAKLREVCVCVCCVLAAACCLLCVGCCMLCAACCVLHAVCVCVVCCVC